MKKDRATGCFFPPSFCFLLDLARLLEELVHDSCVDEGRGESECRVLLFSD